MGITTGHCYHRPSRESAAAVPSFQKDLLSYATLESGLPAASPAPCRSQAPGCSGCIHAPDLSSVATPHACTRGPGAITPSVPALQTPVRYLCPRHPHFRHLCVTTVRVPASWTQCQEGSPQLQHPQGRKNSEGTQQPSPLKTPTAPIATAATCSHRSLPSVLTQSTQRLPCWACPAPGTTTAGVLHPLTVVFHHQYPSVKAARDDCFVKCKVSNRRLRETSRQGNRTPPGDTALLL